MINAFQFICFQSVDTAVFLWLLKNECTGPNTLNCWATYQQSFPFLRFLLMREYKCGQGWKYTFLFKMEKLAVKFKSIQKKSYTDWFFPYSQHIGLAWAVNSNLPWVGLRKRVHFFLIVTSLINRLWKIQEIRSQTMIWPVFFQCT